MAQEKEIKILLEIPHKEFIKRIEQKGFKKIKDLEQEDIYFDTENWDLYKNVAAVRVRKAAGKEKFAYKKVFYFENREDCWHVEELELEFPITVSKDLKDVFRKLNIHDYPEVITDFGDLKMLFNRNGLRDNQIMHKIRETYVYEDAELVIDNIRDLGVVIELECKESNPLEVIGSILDEKEWKRSHEGTNYMGLEKQYGLTLHKNYKDMFKERADWNVLEDEREWYEKLNK